MVSMGGTRLQGARKQTRSFGQPRKSKAQERQEASDAEYSDKPSELEIDIPEWAQPLYTPGIRYKGAKGGRGGGKSHEIATYIILSHVADPDRSTVCLREVQKSLKESVKRLLEQKIRALEVGDHFHITTTEIRSKHGAGIITFQGMSDYTADSIKSLEGYDCAWFEEAQTCSQDSLDKLRPTMRKLGAELIFSWNPQLETDPVDQLFCGPERPPSAALMEACYLDNRYLSPAVLHDAEYDRRMNMEKYEHIWLGKYIKHAEARFFKNWRVEYFETPKEAQIRLGLDWGFDDPLAGVGCFIEEYQGRKRLYIDRECYQVNCTIRDTPGVVLSMRDAEKLQITAGSDRPERIEDLRTAGFNVVPAIRGPNSVQQGLEWLKDFEIIVHPDCTHIIDEFKMFSHPVDKLTKKVLPGFVDKYNHCIEALRYACEAVRRLAKRLGRTQITPLPTLHYWGRTA